METEVLFTMDWLTYRAFFNPHYSYKDAAAGDWQNDWEPTHPSNGYAVAWKHISGATVQWNAKREDMGVLVTYSGSALRWYAEQSLAWPQIMMHHAAKNDVAVRVDAAIDVHNSGIKIFDLYSKAMAGKVTHLGVKKLSIVLSGEDGATFYVGSRQSELMARLYNKAAERGILGDWLRFELEIKHGKAVEFARRIALLDPYHAGEWTKRVLRDLIDYDIPAWKVIFETAPLHLSSPKESDPETAEWLLKSVAPALARFAHKRSSEEFLKQFKARVDAILDQEYNEHLLWYDGDIPF